MTGRGRESGPAADGAAGGPRVFGSAAEFAAAAGTVLGTGPWTAVEQDRIDAFADATDDHQWIHTDPGRAAAGPFGTTVAHGFLTLALLPRLAAGVYRLTGVRAGVNYGLDRVRFPAPLPVGTRVRAVVELVSVDPLPGGVQAATRVTVEAEGSAKPVCVAEWLTRTLFEEPDTASGGKDPA